MVKMLIVSVLCAAMTLGGCAYTTKSQLPEHIRSVHVATIKNSIDLSAEVSDRDHFRVYRPGVEVDLTNAVINRYIFDGNLRVASPEKADALIEATLLDYRRDPLRYTDNDDVQESRLSISLSVKMTDVKSQKIIWQDTVTGDAAFYLSGSKAASEDEAAARAVEDTARRVVEKTFEIW